MLVKFTVPGEPTGKGRPRFGRSGSYVRTYTPEKTKNYEEAVKWQYRAQCGNVLFQKGTPIDVRIIGYYGIPKSDSKSARKAKLEGQLRPLKKCDADNLCKIILDSLNGIAFVDDVQVVDCQIRKFYSDIPRVTVSIQEAVCGKAQK